jgi:hypothetical protein
MAHTFIEGQIVEGNITGNLRRKMIADEYELFADFLVTRVGNRPEETSIPIRLCFFDEQNELLNPPRNTFIRARIDGSNTLYHSIYSTSDKPIRFDEIEFVERGTGRVVHRIPPMLKFDD